MTLTEWLDQTGGLMCIDPVSLHMLTPAAITYDDASGVLTHEGIVQQVSLKTPRELMALGKPHGLTPEFTDTNPTHFIAAWELARDLFLLLRPNILMVPPSDSQYAPLDKFNADVGALRELGW
jgi:hypothetical protein